jgi:dUTP pyrophosphatase
MCILEIKLLTDTAKMPTYGSLDAAGLDLYSDEILTITPGSQVIVRTGVALQIPEGHGGFIWARSGLAVKNRIDTRAGVIDADYRGEIRVVLVNEGSMALHVKRGDRIAQIVIQKYSDNLKLMAVEQFSKETNRDVSAFGSTGR